MVRKQYQEEPGEEQSVRVLFEQLRSEFRIVAESHGILANGLEDLRKEMHQVGTRVGLLETRVGELGQKIDILTARFEVHERAHAS